MTRIEVANVIGSFGIPFAYYQFDEETIKEENITPPFCTFYYSGSDDLYADNSNYERIRQLVIEVYTDAKDFILEDTIERILNENELTFTKDESYIDDEALFMTIYESEVLINE